MQVNFLGLVFDTPYVAAHLWYPWRATALEHRLFDQVKQTTGAEIVDKKKQLTLKIDNETKWEEALATCTRILLGWQDDADQGMERRSWCWLFEGDVNVAGFDHIGGPTSLWTYLRITLESSDPTINPVEQFDLSCFSFEIPSQRGKKKDIRTI